MEDEKESMKELLEILRTLRPDIDFEHETALVDKALIDSFDIVRIVGECNDVFDIEIDVDDLLPENFNSAAAMWELIQTLMNE